MKFEKIRNIKKSIKNKELEKNIYITFDQDWCSEEVLLQTIKIIEKYNFKCTFFMTNETKYLSRMVKNKNIELGIHPNFNLLLNNIHRYGKTFRQVIDFYVKLIPNSVSVRSHSLTQNSRILKELYLRGLKYECNTYIPFFNNIKLKPFYGATKLLSVPHFWEDDLDFERSYDPKKLINLKTLKVFGFHPIHIFLNTDKIERYEAAKKYNQNFKRLSKFKNSGYGVQNFLIKILEIVK